MILFMILHYVNKASNSYSNYTYNITKNNNLFNIAGDNYYYKEHK